MADSEGFETASVIMITAALGLEYDEERALILISNIASGLTVDQATRRGTMMITKIAMVFIAQLK